jgi:hypothetical protein
MFVTPGSFTPPGRVILQFSSPRLTASHKVAGSTSKVGKRIVGIVDPPKGSATIVFILAQLFGGFGAGRRNRDEPAQVAGGRKLMALTLGSLGVVYGDIGTSPLYAFREALLAAIGGERGVIDTESVLGVLSLILMIVVTAKYVLILLRVHNRGEGGTLALMVLAQRALGRPSTVVLILGIVGAALFYGDALITPAISVLSAIEAKPKGQRGDALDDQKSLRD